MKNISAVEFKFLSQVMAYPDGKFLKALLEINKKIPPNISFVDDLIKIAERENLSELQAEHTRLFISGYPTTPCPPYESFFLEGRLFGNANSIVQNVYSKWAIDVEPALSDHIATEFEFVALLKALSETSDNYNEAIETVNIFFNEHILKWVPNFAKTLKTNTQNKFYKLYADILLNLLGK